MYPLLTNTALSRPVILRRLRDALQLGERSRLLAVILVLAFTLAGGLLRFQAQQIGAYSHPDEQIALAVVTKVLQTDTADTNWARTDVSERFRYDQYNFSSYYLFAAYIETLSGDAEGDVAHPIGRMVRHLRQLSVWLGTLCILLAGALGWRVAGTTASATAAGLTAISVTLFQDSLYARPEAFVTALSLALLLVLTSRRLHRGIVLTLSGLIIGLLIACKITFLMYVPFPILLAPAFLSTQDEGDSSNPHLVYWSGSLCAYFLAMGIGFYIGAPYAVQFPWEYINGVKYLFTQYENGWWPNGLLPTSTLLERLGNGLTYLIYTVGYLALVLSCFGMARLIRTRDVRAALILAGPMLTLLYFIQTKAFFERNFSQALPVLFVLIGIGIHSCISHFRKRPGLRTAAATVLLAGCLVAPGTVIAKIFHPVLDLDYAKKIEMPTVITPEGTQALVLYGPVPLRRTLVVNGNYCGNYVYAIRYYGNTEEMGHLLAKGFRVDGWVTSVFGDKQYSTLQTYLAPPILYLAPPAPKSGHCDLEIGPLKMNPGATTIPAHLSMTGGWSLNGTPIRMKAEDWPWPLYGSWSGSDSNTGILTIGPFRSCGEVAVPLVGGRGTSDLSLQIDRKMDGKEEGIVTTLPPFAYYKWEQLTIHNSEHRCATYTIKATDAGQTWESWLGVGAPVSLPGPPSH